MDTQSLIRRYPLIYRMAEKDTWPSIKSIGLLSTSAALDHCGINGEERVELESRHRPTKVRIGAPGDGIILRDQQPMAPARLKMALPDGVAPEEWYRRLNGLVFTWAEETRLLGLLNARLYRNLEHDVLTIDSRSLITAHEQSISLCHMNSGNTFPMPTKRDLGIFQRISDYPAKRDGGPAKNVVEIVVGYRIPDIREHVVRVRRMRGAETIRDLEL
jgi:hypothetical protein